MYVLLDAGEIHGIHLCKVKKEKHVRPHVVLVNDVVLEALKMKISANENCA